MAKIKLISGQGGVIMRSQEMRDFLADMVERIASTAQASAPYVSGAYHDSITSYVEEKPDPRGGSRAVGIVSSISPYAMKVEAATGNLARALGSINA